MEQYTHDISRRAR